MFVWTRPGAAALFLACVLAACGGGDPIPTGPLDASAADATSGGERPRPLIRLYDNLPSPGQITVQAGALVEWRNVGANSHTVTNYSQGYDEWDDALVQPGQTFVHVFQEPGDYGFICIIHQEVGYVSVVEASMDMDMDMDDMMGDMNPDMVP